VNKSRALFATHYHELTELVESLDGAENASLRAKEWDGDLVFLAVLERLESESVKTATMPAGLPLFTAAVATPAKPSELDMTLARLDVDSLSPRQAHELLYELTGKAKDKVG